MAVTKRVRQVIQAANTVMQSDEFEEFLMNAEDFVSRRDEEGSATTKISQTITNLNDAAQVLNQSLSKSAEGDSPRNERRVNVISPVVIAKSHRSWLWVILVIIGIVFGASGGAIAGLIDSEVGSVLFGWPFWLLLLGYFAFNIWKNSYVMIPDGCRALASHAI